MPFEIIFSLLKSHIINGFKSCAGAGEAGGAGGAGGVRGREEAREALLRVLPRMSITDGLDWLVVTVWSGLL